MKISETSLLDYLVHPITVTSISLSGLKDEQRKETFFVGAIFNKYRDSIVVEILACSCNIKNILLALISEMAKKCFFL